MPRMFPQNVIYGKYKYENSKIDDLISCLTLHVKLCVDRYGIGFELKESYFDLAKKNISSAVLEKSQASLF